MEMKIKSEIFKKIDECISDENAEHKLKTLEEMGLSLVDILELALNKQ